MRRVALFLAACVAVVSAIGLCAQQADSIAGSNNPSQASQSVPRLIMFSGTVKDLTGKPLAGPVELNFAIYKEQADAAPLWQESQTLNVDVQGRYTALLGAMQPEGLPVDLFTSGEARWLGVSAGRLPEQPRVLLVSVPYALKANDAEMLAGKPASAYMLTEPPLGPLLGKEGSGVVDRVHGELATPRKPKSGAKPNLAGTGTLNYIPRWTDSAGTLGNSVIFQSGNNVGFGTTTPGYRLDVVGGSARVTNPSGTTQLVVSGSASSGRLGQDAGGFFFSSDTNGGAVRFLTNNGTLHEWMRITSAGNVGVGTTTPAKTLDVAGTGSFSGSTTAVNSSLLTVTQAGSTTTAPTTSLPPAAVYGNATATSNYAVGVVGNASSPSGWGVVGTGGAFGVLGAIQNTSDSSVGVEAYNGATTGYGKALEAVVNSPNGTAGQFGSSAAGARLINAEYGPSGSRASVFQVDTSGNVWANGSVGIGTITPGQALDVAGNIRASGCFYAGSTVVGGTCASDARLKTRIEGFPPVLSKLVQLRPVNFSWRVEEFPEMHFGSSRSYGLIAQEVEEVFPEMVSKEEHGFKAVDYTRLPLLLLGAVRELKAENDGLREQVRGQVEQIGVLTRQVQEMEKVQRRMATLEARLAQIEARTAKPQPRSVKRTAPAKPAPGSMKLAKVQF